MKPRSNSTHSQGVTQVKIVVKEEEMQVNYGHEYTLFGMIAFRV